MHEPGETNIFNSERCGQSPSPCPPSPHQGGCSSFTPPAARFLRPALFTELLNMAQAWCLETQPGIDFSSIEFAEKLRSILRSLRAPLRSSVPLPPLPFRAFLLQHLPLWRLQLPHSSQPDSSILQGSAQAPPSPGSPTWPSRHGLHPHTYPLIVAAWLLVGPRNRELVHRGRRDSPCSCMAHLS